MKRILRVFPRRTKATPDDDMAVVGEPSGKYDVDEVHISVTFSWDLPEAERLERLWRWVAPCKIGGPATGHRGEEFVPGMYVKKGYTITSRGCNNKCWFCEVWKRDGKIRELPIRPGYNVLDDNILSTSLWHQKSVIAMLKDQKKLGHRVEFTGGLEAALLSEWHIKALRDLRPKQMFFAYDTPDDWDPLNRAAGMLREAGWTYNTLRCYVLCGWPKDSKEDADRRLTSVWNLGITPMAMLYRDKLGKVDSEWKKFQRLWARPALIKSRMKASPS